MSPHRSTSRRIVVRAASITGIVALAGTLSIASTPQSHPATVVVNPGQSKSTSITKAPAESGARVEFTVPALSGGAVIVAGELRRTGDTAYRTRVMVFASGTMRVGLVRVAKGRETMLASQDLQTLAHRGQRVVVDGTVSGSSKVVLRVRSWIDGTSRPDWQRTYVDGSRSRISTAGSTAAWTYLSRNTSRRTSVALTSFSALRRPVTPQTTITSAPPANLTSGSAVVRFGSNVPDARFVCTLNGRTLSRCASPMKLSGLSAGGYTFRVRAVSAFGTVDPSTASAAFRVGRQPAAGAKPSAATTGVPAGTKLRIHRGTIVVDRPGTVLDRLDVRGFVIVRAPNVTISNSVIRGGRATGNIGLITNYGAKNLVITDTTVKATTPSVWVDGIKGWNFTARRVHVVGNVDSIKIHGDNVTVADSLLEDTTYFRSDPNQGGGATHNDNIQILNGRNLTIARNTIRGATNFAILGAANKGDVPNLTIKDNWVDGGWCTVKLQVIGNRSLSAEVDGNRFGPNRKIDYCPMQVEPKVKLSAAANVMEADGTPVKIYRGR